MNENIKNKLIKVFENVSCARGVSADSPFDDEVCFSGKYLDDYLAVGTLADLLKQDKIEITLKADETDRKVYYLLRLLDLIRKEGE